MRAPFLLVVLVTFLNTHAQQFDLNWATPAPQGIVRVKFAANGEVFALGTGGNNVVLQRYSTTGNVLWTKTFSAPSLYAIDMDVDASDNVFIYVGLSTGQLDLDPGPFTTLVDPGKVYAKYTSSGQFLWGFSVENTTDLSEDYGGISCDDAGNLFIAGDLGQGTYDMDPGPGVFDLVVPSSCIGTFVARYRADGSLHWAEVSAWPSSFSSSRDIAALRDGSGFYFTRSLDNGGPLSGQIDVDPGPGIFNVYNDSQHLLRYDSSFAFIAHAYIGYGDQRLAVDEADNAYLMARASAGAGFWALKFDRSGQTLNQIYQTALISTGNLRLGDYVADEQGGAIGSYSNNCTASYYRFFKMNVSGLVDFSLQLYSGTDCTYPIAKGFDLRGGTFAVGSLNQNYAVDFDPGPGVLSLPSGNDDGVVALYGWCGGAPYDPFGIDVLTSSWCVGDTVSLAVDAFGDASTYTWDPGTWNIAAGQGTGTVQLLAVDAGPSTIGVAATNACGSSAPVTLPLTAGSATADLPPSETVCDSLTTILDPGPCPGCTYVWQPGNASTPTLPISITQTTTFSVTATQGTCAVSDSTTITIEICTGLADAHASAVRLGPVPALAGQELVLTGVTAGRLLRLTTVEGRLTSTPFSTTGDRVVLPTAGLAPGTYLLHGAADQALRVVLQ
ncbi:MAG: hypothetical protein IPJ87_02080 [Flavobacteriales bacterium]|jgi:hypothetical protein|nr:hypothetical protein [Flavobacteriales bacterium]MBK8950399.1 hypothetical protein [Flavobacteriales bacterium]MBK9700921.1 hypothetical protein [Flavobacteriales bacterium]